MLSLIFDDGIGAIKVKKCRYLSTTNSL